MKKFIEVTFLTMVVFVLCISPAQSQDMCKEKVNTAEGPVIGMTEPESNACAYKGIPYAAPPVGDFRWRAPAPAPKRDKALDAIKFAPDCKQIGMGIPSFAEGGEVRPQSEDCLYVNVWRPKKSGVFPVMVWIHGGALIAGSGAEPTYRGDRLAAEKNMVVVTINYRLGALGFLSHRNLSAEDPHKSTGNYGLLDQIAALAWVKENIAAFGGDPKNVTIFGESAGGWSVCNLLASTPAAGLFQKAILQSGGCDTTTTPEDGFANGDKFAALLGCSGEDVLSCMRSKSGDAVIDATRKASPNFSDLGFRQRPFVWVPMEDGYALKETPIKALQSGRYNQVPLMIGSNRDEYKLLASMNGMGYRFTRKSKVKALVENSLPASALPIFSKLYPLEKYHRALDALLDAKGDQILGCKTFEGAIASSMYQPTYYYRFDYDDNRTPEILGAAHAVEIPFIFDAMDRPYFKLLYSKKQRKRARPLVDSMMSYWTNFAASGDPNGANLVKWPSYNQKDRLRIYLDLPLHVNPTDNIEKCEFWRAQGQNPE